MARHDNRYSRFVATLKVVLLLSSLAILSTLFLVARGPSPQDLPFSERDLRAMVDTQRVQGPTYRGLTADGRAVTVAADSAVPRRENADLVDVFQLSAVLQSADAAETTLSSDEGILDNAAREMQFDGNVRIDTPEGYALRTEVLTTALDGSTANAPGQVHLTGPGLDLTAGAMEMTAESSASPRVVFKQGVRLIYTPSNE